MQGNRQAGLPDDPIVGGQVAQDPGGKITTILRLPGGAELPVPCNQSIEAVYWRHSAMSLTEGMCPHHQTPLTAVATGDGSIGAHCADCRRYWRYDPAVPDGLVSWDLDYDPITMQPAFPAWGSVT